MPRPSEEDKLSEIELSRLREMVDRGRQVYGSSRNFALAAGVSPSAVSQAMHGRLVAKARHSLRILNFEFRDDATEAGVEPNMVNRQTAGVLDEELMVAISAVTGDTHRGRRDLLKMLRAAADLKNTKK
ncbi:hypothetical protein [Azospirillum brasilense]|uniref:hypothetical protein n=1 Tax=Azospirillum brasilense TaxID=192 RepID=UPI001EDA839B|nr:hypothetical protein [Azospirillum brasilense]UKJ73255.1 hypothetical protein H1Q64_01115 [Azospirillum brasilense]UKJ75456.1 hypothetical protein H1Q64_14485 [Azospirillum brasilense]